MKLRIENCEVGNANGTSQFVIFLQRGLETEGLQRPFPPTSQPCIIPAYDLETSSDCFGCYWAVGVGVAEGGFAL